MVFLKWPFSFVFSSLYCPFPFLNDAFYDLRTLSLGLNFRAIKRLLRFLTWTGFWILILDMIRVHVEHRTFVFFPLRFWISTGFWTSPFGHVSGSR